MFTGIVEEVGRLVRREPSGSLVRLRLEARVVLDDARIGDSICHNGVCLTIVELRPPQYAADVMGETLRATTLGDLAPGAKVNLERALGVGGRFGGHLVQGHVDGVGTLRRITREAEWITYEFGAPESVLPYVVPKGSIAIDGISLTVVDRLPDGFTVSLIPHTLAVTTLGERREGDRVNLEADTMAKYVAATVQRMLAGEGPREHGTGAGGEGRIPGMTLEWLAENGFGPSANG